MNLVSVLLPNHLDGCFTYQAETKLEVGSYVLASFAGRKLPGIVWKQAPENIAPGKIKHLLGVFEHLPGMSPEMIAFVERVSQYTLAPRGAVLKMVLPSFEALNEQSARERANVFSEINYIAANLSKPQQIAAEVLKEKIAAGFSCSLLDGVTGSGKTEVYFASIAKALENKKQVLVLLPEISLSVQWLERFTVRFGAKPYIWHSSITKAQRKHTWRAIVNGQAKVVVGARSALFLPYNNIGLIVVDEEHEASFKQEDGVMYHARDMAVLKAHIEKIPIVLSSATPALETWHNVLQNKYNIITLPERFSGVEPPVVRLIDMREEKIAPENFLSDGLVQAIVSAIAEKKQSLLFLNRRGYAPLTLCRKCGHRFECKFCSAWLVHHKKSLRLNCHHCGYTEIFPKACGACGAEESLHPVGPGVERVAEEIVRRINGVRIGVLSSDNSSHNQMQEVLVAMQNSEIDVLVGTQMIAKGHHFPKLKIVGVVDADLGLEGGDPRAVERTFQVLHQIGGRAGRENERGLVFIQTYAPKHEVMKALAAGDRDNLMNLELAGRERSHMPPFSRLANILIDGVDEQNVLSEARRISSLAPNHPKLRVLGPAPAPLYRLKNRFRVRILLQADRNLNLQQLISSWLKEAKPASNINIKVDIDPYHFL